MDSELYNAAKSGDWDAIKQFESQLYIQRTSKQNSVLHILAYFCDSSFAVERILEIHPKLLTELNTKDETAFHFAARMGHPNVVRALIECAKQSNEELWQTMLRSRSKSGNLALHEALKGDYIPQIVHLLVQEGADLIHILNNAKESPLYLAVDRGYQNVATLMLSICKSSASPFSTKFLPDENGFKTPLHAAAIRNLPECVKLILEKLPNLAKKADEFGWTPLHYAARFNHQNVAKQLLVANRSMAYVKTKSNGTKEKDSEMTALHVAVCEGNTQLIEEILSYCPDCWEMVTNHGKNVIHLAMENEKKEVLEFILEKSWATDLMNQKDTHGNTPLHLYVATKNLLGSNLENHPEVDSTATNNAGYTPQTALDAVRETNILVNNALEVVGGAIQGDVIARTEDQKVPKRNRRHESTKEEGEDAELEGKMDTYLPIATLIITVSFAAGFTIPGGYEGNDAATKGLAVLAKKAVFQAFIVCDAFALMASTIVVVIVLVLPNSRNQRAHLSYHRCCEILMVSALVALGISFFTGLYVTIPKRGIRIYLILMFLLPVVLHGLSGGKILKLANSS